MNLTAVRDPEEIVARHFGESFFAGAALAADHADSKVIDVGSGAGFPGIPIAMLMPEAEVTLIEAHGRKATFLKEVVFALGLMNVKVFGGRAENYGSQAQLVTLRAVESFERTLLTALALVKRGGQIALMIGSSQLEAVNNAGAEVDWIQPKAIPGGHSRVLLVGTKRVKVEQE